jgi:hypothetical protein
MNAFKKFFSRHRTPLHIHTQTLTGLNYDYIADGIFIGTNQCCTTGLSEVLKKEGITCDISLEGEALDAPYGVEAYVWIPTIDHFAPTIDQVNFGVEALKKLVAEKKKIYIHCKNGHGRSSTLMSAYLMRTRNLPYEEAFAIVKAGRPGAHMQVCQVELLKK